MQAHKRICDKTYTQKRLDAKAPAAAAALRHLVHLVDHRHDRDGDEAHVGDVLRRALGVVRDHRVEREHEECEEGEARQVEAYRQYQTRSKALAN